MILFPDLLNQCVWFSYIPVYEYCVLVVGVPNEEEFGHQDLCVENGSGEEQRNTVCTGENDLIIRLASITV